VAIGPSGVGPGASIPLTTEWLQALKAKNKEAGQVDATEKRADLSELSKDAQKLSSTKEERMISSMREELANLDTESETFLQDATEKLIDSVIDQEYGEHFKKQPGYGNLQDKLTQTVLENADSREALSEFFEMLLMTEPDEDDEGGGHSSHEEEDEDDEESYEEDEDEE
jgi:hypothetical protein